MNNQEMTDEYREGLREGQILALQEVQKAHNNRLNEHSKRISVLERTTYMILGAILFIQIFPTLKNILN